MQETNNSNPNKNILATIVCQCLRFDEIPFSFFSKMKNTDSANQKVLLLLYLRFLLLMSL